MNPLHLFLWPTGRIRPFSYGANMMCASLLAVLPVLLLNIDSFSEVVTAMRHGAAPDFRALLARPDVQAAFLFGLWMHTCLSCKRARDAWGSPALGVVYGLAGASLLAFGREENMIAFAAELLVLAISMVLVAVKSAAPSTTVGDTEVEQAGALGNLSDEDLLRRAAMLNAQAPSLQTPTAPVSTAQARTAGMAIKRPAFGKR